VPMRGFIRLALLALMCLSMVPAAAYAQGASIAGVVKDTSGAVLPGVTVEAASPVLIEKVRTAVTDGSGQYKIIEILPGTYTVTFSLTGFSTVKHDGVEVTGTSTASVNAELKVGTVSETITVSGETPVVDVQSASVQTVVTKEVIDNIPTGRLGINLAALQPGIILGTTSGAGTLSGNANTLASTDVGGTAGDTFTDLSIHGGKSSEMRQLINGLSAATVIRFGESLSSSPSFSAMQEMSVDSSGGDATQPAGGVRMNYILRDGGNTYKGIFFFTGANQSMQFTNYTTIAQDGASSLQARGLKTQPGALDKVFDVNPGYGGPVLTDKLWFFATARWTEAVNYVTQDYPNLNFVPGVTPSNLFNDTTLTYAPNLSAPLSTTYGGGGDFKEETLRLTWQASPRNKFSAYYNNKVRRDINGLTTTANESLNASYFFPFSDQLVQWSSPVNNKLLLEAGIWHHQETWGGSVLPFNQADPLAIGVTDNNPYPGITPNYTQLINNYHGRVGSDFTPSHNPNTRSNFAASYVTGSHAFKFGEDFSWANRGAWTGSIVPYSYVVSTIVPGELGIPVPTSINLRTDGCQDPLARIVNGGLTAAQATYNPALNCPTFVDGKINGEGGLYAQDRWTLNRVTVNLGVRFDAFYASIPAYNLGPSLLTPNRNYTVPGYESVGQKDITPKMAVAWDVMGDGKTAVKVNVSKYVLGESLVASNPLIGLSPFNTVLTGTRSWTDNNGNFIPDCNLSNPNAQGPTQAGANFAVDTCGAASTSLFANSPLSQPAGDSASRYGWGVRPYAWEFDVTLQRELGKGVSVYGGFFRRWFGNFLVTDDLNHAASDYESFSITPGSIPTSPASAGGSQLPSNIYTQQFMVLKPGSLTASSPEVGLSDQLYPGSNVIDHWNGFDFSLNARLGGGVILQGGTSTGRQVTNDCGVTSQDPGMLISNTLLGGVNAAGAGGAAISPVASCAVTQPFLTQLKFLASYTVPKINVQLGAAYQNIPGIELAATYAEPNSDIARPVTAGGLGHLPFGQVSATATTALAIIPPETDYYNRLNQLDIRIGKIVKFGGRARMNLSLDLYNLFNEGTITAASFSYTTWLAPSSVIAPRLAKVSLTFDF
jgi:Carboxypeptidase regulatory-like domain